MSKRTDLHRPSVIVPSHYEFVAMDYYGDALGMSEFLKYERQAYRAHKAKTGGKTYESETQTGTCDCCGAHALYVGKFYYAPANEYVTLGHICAMKMEVGDDTAFKSFHKNVRAQLERLSKTVKAKQYLTLEGMSDVVTFYEATRATLATWDSETNGDWWASLTWEQRVADEMMGKLIQYGSLSEKQLALLRKLPAQHATNVAKKAAWAAERAAKNAAAAPLPASESRMAIVGKIVTVKGQDTLYGFQWKMLVEHADGWKVWGSVPVALLDEVTKAESSATNADGIRKEIRELLIGKRVEFFAKVKVSDNDPKFGFFNRPTKAGFIMEAATE